MAELYALAVIRGNRTFSSVPKVYQTAVKKLLKQKLSSEEYNTIIKA